MTEKTEKKNYISSSRKEPLSGAIVIHGPPAHGKTRMAATSSTFFPRQESVCLAPLSDIVFLPYDQGALDGLSVEGIDAPMIKVRDIIADMGAVRGTFEALKTLEVYLKEHPECRYVVVDTISEMAAGWQSVFAKEADGDKWAVLRNLEAAHTNFHVAMNKVCSPTGAVPIYLSHSKARVVTSETGDAQKAALTADKLPGGNDIGLDIDGSGRGTYTRNATLVIAIRCKVAGGKSTYKAYPRGGDGFEGKDRLARILPDVVEPDLQGIFSTIKAKMAELEQQENAK